MGTDLCHDNATCTNTDGNYTCDCQPGFNGTGFNCSSKPNINFNTPAKVSSY